MRNLVIPVLTILILGLATIAIIAYGRGRRLNPQDGKVVATGLLNATSEPDGAQVYVDGILKTATNSTLNLLPGTYKVKITKEGYLPWEKEMPIFKEVVAQTEAFLFPANPGLSPLTTSGVTNPTVSPDGTSIAFLVPVRNQDQEATPSAIGSEASYKDVTTTQKQTGIYVLDLQDRPLSFTQKPRQILSYPDLPNFPDIPDLAISLIWSPDSKQLLAVFDRAKLSDEVKSLALTDASTAYLLDASRPNPQPQLVASPAEILKLWEEQREIEARSKIESLPDDLVPIASASAEIIEFSPDESKILYQATQATTIPQIIKPPLIGVNPTEEQRTIEPGNLYVYDIKEDRNYLLVQMVDGRQSSVNNSSNLEPRTSNAAPQAQLQWFPTSRHLFHVDEGKIKVMEYDRTNQTAVYAGPFEPDFVVPWPNGSKFVILTTLNPDAAATLNLYAVKLR